MTIIHINISCHWCYFFLIFLPEGKKNLKKKKKREKETPLFHRKQTTEYAVLSICSRVPNRYFTRVRTWDFRPRLSAFQPLLWPRVHGNNHVISVWKQWGGIWGRDTRAYFDKLVNPRLTNWGREGKHRHLHGPLYN